MRMSSTGAHTDVYQSRRMHSRCVSVCINKPALPSGPFIFTMGDMMACAIPDSLWLLQESFSLLFFCHASAVSPNQENSHSLPLLPRSSRLISRDNDNTGFLPRSCYQATLRVGLGPAGRGAFATLVLLESSSPFFRWVSSVCPLPLISLLHLADFLPFFCPPVF